MWKIFWKKRSMFFHFCFGIQAKNKENRIFQVGMWKQKTKKIVFLEGLQLAETHICSASVDGVMATFWLVQPFWNGSLGPCLFVDEYLPFFAFFLKSASRFLNFFGGRFRDVSPLNSDFWGVDCLVDWNVRADETLFSVGLQLSWNMLSYWQQFQAPTIWVSQIWDSKCIQIFLNFQDQKLGSLFHPKGWRSRTVADLKGSTCNSNGESQDSPAWKITRNYDIPKKTPTGFLDVFFSKDELFRIVLRKQHQHENPGWFCWKRGHDNSLDSLVMRMFFSGRAKRWSSSAAVISLISRRKSSRWAPAPHDWEFIGKCDGENGEGISWGDELDPGKLRWNLKMTQ